MSTNHRPLFSIITICYNEENRILKTMESVFLQKYKNYEHIIEDGKSQDRTIEIIEKTRDRYKEGQLKIFSEKDNGLYDAMNRAIKRASGEYLCFINSGDYLYNADTLENIAAVINECPGMDWYYGECIVIFPNGDEYMQIPTTIENVNGNDLNEYLKNNQLGLMHQSIFAHQSCFIDNLFDTTLHLRAELKWYYECLLRKQKIKRLLFPVCKYSYGGLSERSESMPINAKEVKIILNEYGLLNEKSIEALSDENNYIEFYKNLYSTWLAIYQAGYSIKDYLEYRNIKSVAIYGYAELGAHLVNELKRSKIKIKCLIDMKDKNSYSGIKVRKPETFNEQVDMIIVTAIMHYKEVEDSMKKITDCRIVSLEHLIEEVWRKMI